MASLERKYAYASIGDVMSALEYISLASPVNGTCMECRISISRRQQCRFDCHREGDSSRYRCFRCRKNR